MEQIKDMFFVDNEPQIVSEARKHIHEEFEDLEFYEDGHKYILHGQEITMSVSGVGHRFIRDPFNEQLQAERYAQKHVETAEYWIKQWRCNSFRATTLGTKTHEYGESLSYLLAGHPELIRPMILPQYNKEYNYLAPIHPKEESVMRFLTSIPKSMHLVTNEAKVYSGKNPAASKNLNELICGTFDMLYYYDGEGNAEKAGFIILDYKTNGNLYSEYNQKYGKTLLPPFDDIIEQDLGLYTIQLSLYSLMLEDIGIPVIDRRVVWLKADGEYEIISVSDVSQKLRNVL